METRKVKVFVDKGKCKKCGICSAFCPQKVFELAKDGSPLVRHGENCSYCRLCDLRCPDYAISLEVVS